MQTDEHTVRSGAGTGLPLIDTTNEVFHQEREGIPFYQAGFDRIGTFHNLKRLLARGARTGPPGILPPWHKRLAGIHQVLFENRRFEEGRWGAEFHPDLSPTCDDIVIAPHKNIDVLATTDLDVELRQHRAEYITVTGMIGTMCVESTA
ncbi:isochorismatase family protein [Streptomyces sp. NPDC018026]|uniref:isochorismatase family protein n=1 Tax=Streptomyces sp. NPDC018026 TaxID=3365031 RepID=UPI0037909FA1